jgi:hypothetical protein
VCWFCVGIITLLRPPRLDDDRDILQSVLQVTAKNVGSGAAAASDKAGNLAKQIPICIGACLIPTSNL